MTFFVEGNVISAKVDGYLHGMFAKLGIAKYTASFRHYDIQFHILVKKMEVDFEYMKMASRSQGAKNHIHIGPVM